MAAVHAAAGSPPPPPRNDVDTASRPIGSGSVGGNSSGGGAATTHVAQAAAAPSAVTDSGMSRSQRAVPANAVSRAVHFGGLGIGLAAGAAAAAVRRALNGTREGESGLLLATDANVERLAGTLCRLRGAALKVGQMLSFNDADVLPPPMRVAMERVRDGADFMPPRQLEATLREELGDDWRANLASFEETPVASASIGQVHRAVLDDGRPVAIKVQYPGVADSIVSDLWSMKQLITYTGLVPPGLFLDRVSRPPPFDIRPPTPPPRVRDTATAMRPACPRRAMIQIRTICPKTEDGSIHGA